MELTDAQVRMLSRLEKLEPVLQKLEDLVTRAGPDRVMWALSRLDSFLNNPASRFAAGRRK